MKNTNNNTLSVSDQKKLWIINLCAAVLHAVQGVLVLIFSSSFSLPFTTAFVQLNTTTQKLEPVIEKIGSLRIGPVIAGFFFLSALAHLSVSLSRIHEWYLSNLAKGINIARWIEYSLSSSLMIVVIAMLVGMYDVVSLMLMFGLNAMMIFFGWVMELHNQTTEKTNWTSYIFGTIAGAIPWIAIAIFLLGAGSGDAKPPTFVYWIFFSIFIFFDIFALNMFLQYKKVGPWKKYLYGEYAYIILSLVAKSLLAWQVWAGTLRPL